MSFTFFGLSCQKTMRMISLLFFGSFPVSLAFGGSFLHTLALYSLSDIAWDFGECHSFSLSPAWNFGSGLSRVLWIPVFPRAKYIVSHSSFY